MGRYFPYRGMEHPWEWQLHLRTTNTPETNPDGLAHKKIMLSFRAIISATSFKNRGNAPKGSTPPYVSRSIGSRHRSPEDRRIAPRLREKDKGVTNYSRHCLLSNWQPTSEAFSAGATTKPPQCPTRAGIDGFTCKIEPVSPITYMNRWSA